MGGWTEDKEMVVDVNCRIQAKDIVFDNKIIEK